jgi:putative oxidoreductase
MRTRDLLFGGAGGGSKLADAGLLVVRVVAGVALAVNHGAGKIQDPAGVIRSAHSMGFPAPTFFGWMAALSEFFGGILLALGLATRPAAFLVACTMGTAALLFHADDNFKTREPALVFLSVAVLFLLAGSGRYGVDALLRRKKG